jgi:hypothetical protein
MSRVNAHCPFWSPPTRGRGLKHWREQPGDGALMSPPTRGRGLKHRSRRTAVAALRWVAWPLLPVGFVTSHGAFIGYVWFSIFLGWMAKVLIVRFGGVKLFQSARPFFLGLILGEALATGTWLLVNAILVTSGAESRPVHFVP